MATMFSNLSEFRSKCSSQNGPRRSPQGEEYHFSCNDIEYSRYRFTCDQLYPTECPSGVSPAAPLVHLAHRPSFFVLGKNATPIPSVAPLTEICNSGDSDDNISLAERLFPVTPPAEMLLGPRLSHEGFTSDDDLIGPTKPPLGYDLRKQVGNARRSVDMAVIKKSWSLQDVEGFNDSSIGRKSNFNFKKDVAYESRRAIWVSDAFEGGTTRSSTSSLEERSDSGPAVLPAFEDAEDEFLEEFADYCSSVKVDNVRRIQYPNLELRKIVYLDYASFSLFSNFQVEQYLKILLAHGPCLGSASFTSSSDNPLFKYVAHTQRRLLRMLNTTPDHYSIIFTAGFQESFRLVAQAYPFQKGSPLLVCQDNHAVVRQVIRSAQRAGGKPILFPITEKELCFHGHDLQKQLRSQAGRHTINSGLFIYPAQSNLSGIKHSLCWVVEAQQNGWNVCLDASTILPTIALDLDIHQPDLVIGSFHHMVGYPSGMGFLLVRRESFCVQASPSGEKVQFLRNKPADKGENCHIMCPADNTMNLLHFAALNLGLIQLEHIGFIAIQNRVRSLAQWLVRRLLTLKHKDGDQAFVLRVYGSHAAKDRGSIVSFNVLDSSGTILPPHMVRKLAARCNIQLSVGNFHNLGLASLLEGQANEIQPNANDCSVLERVSGFAAVRVSFGAVSNFADVYALVQFLSRFRDEEYLATQAETQ